MVAPGTSQTDPGASIAGVRLAHLARWCWSRLGQLGPPPRVVVRPRVDALFGGQAHHITSTVELWPSPAWSRADVAAVLLHELVHLAVGPWAPPHGDHFNRVLIAAAWSVFHVRVAARPSAPRGYGPSERLRALLVVLFAKGRRALPVEARREPRTRPPGWREVAFTFEAT